MDRAGPRGWPRELEPGAGARPRESAAHRRARRQRQADRVLCQLAAATLHLARHHSSAVPRILQGLRAPRRPPPA
eukprot:342211-Alexandrium_andersonii.AAC.1